MLERFPVRALVPVLIGTQGVGQMLVSGRIQVRIPVLGRFPVQVLVPVLIGTQAVGQMPVRIPVLGRIRV